MEKFYRHFKGGLYRFAGIAKDSETQKEMVLYQALYGDKQMWVRPKDMFFEKVERDGVVMDRFVEITEEEIPVAINPKYHFPDIDFTNQKLPMTLGEYSKSVKTIISLLQNHNIVPSGFFQGLHSDDDLEKEALRRIDEYQPGDDQESIFHLIQAWGGSSGRGVYVRGNGFDWSAIRPAYEDLIHACLSMRTATENNIAYLVSAVEQFDKSVQNLGVSFITKHTRFWLHKSMGSENALPIYDSVMARNVMGKDSPRISDLAEYWTVMCAKARSLQVDLVPFERQLFVYYYNPTWTFKGFTFKYYHGEVQNPFSETNENASMWWNGEKLFYDSISREDGDKFIETIKEWYEGALKDDDLFGIHRDVKISKRNHILLFYLDMWHGKWFPYDSFEEILRY